jgi:hypothetical protein
MIADMDFIALYEELGLTPGTCSLSEFKLAYRRRMQQLHPDRNPDPGGESAPESLQHLMAIYREAIAFERRFGRLPGAEPNNGRRTGGATQAGSATAHHASVTVAPGQQTPWRRVIFASLVLLALGWVLWGVGLLVF